MQCKNRHNNIDVGVYVCVSLRSVISVSLRCKLYALKNVRESQRVWGWRPFLFLASFDSRESSTNAAETEIGCVHFLHTRLSFPL